MGVWVGGSKEAPNEKQGPGWNCWELGVLGPLTGPQGLPSLPKGSALHLH